MNKLAAFFIVWMILTGSEFATSFADNIEQGFAAPPQEARLRCYWWWLNGNVTKEAITRDLEEMKAKGYGGTLVFDASSSSVNSNPPVPAGPVFGGKQWRELFRHVLREADRLELEISLNIQSGWDLGGPLVTPDRSAKRLVFSGVEIKGPGPVEKSLPRPKTNLNFYRDVAVLAFPTPKKEHAPISRLRHKTSRAEFGRSAPDCTPLLEDIPAREGEQVCRASDVLDLTGKTDAKGVLRWDAPPGDWSVLRVGYTYSGARVTNSSGDWQGPVLDYLSADCLRWYWNKVVEPLIADAGPLAGTTWKYIHTDSWECKGMNWTPGFREQFRQRRGYDLMPFMPVVAGYIVDDRTTANRFLADFRKTIGDCIAENHCQVLAQLARKHGISTHLESGGPHAGPFDSLRCLGTNDVPMSEFWAESWTHRVTDEDRFFVKQPASVAHTYGRRLVAAESFTTQGPNWQATIWDNLKPSFDRAACEGLNRVVWHAFTCSPEEMGIPGQEYAAGTHLNPNVTWWPYSTAFLTYLNRCQFMLQQGLFVGDAVYYYGDHVPNFTQLKKSDPAKVLPGYDYDVATEEVVLGRMNVKDGRIVLPDGMSYAVLVMPPLPAVSLMVLRKIERMVEEGATVVGPKPQRASGLGNQPQMAGLGATAGLSSSAGSTPANLTAGQASSGTHQPQNDQEVRRIADRLWGEDGKGRTVGRGRVIADRTAREVFQADGFPPDFDYEILPSPRGRIAAKKTPLSSWGRGRRKTPLSLWERGRG